MGGLLGDCIRMLRRLISGHVPEGVPIEERDLAEPEKDRMVFVEAEVSGSARLLNIKEGCRKAWVHQRLLRMH